jgi:hypothetical protein
MSCADLNEDIKIVSSVFFASYSLVGIAFLLFHYGRFKSPGIMKLFFKPSNFHCVPRIKVLEALKAFLHNNTKKTLK